MFNKINIKIILLKILKRFLFFSLFYCIRSYISYDDFSFMFCEDIRLKSDNTTENIVYGFGFVCLIGFFFYNKYYGKLKKTYLENTWDLSIPVIKEPVYTNQQLIPYINKEVKTSLLSKKSYTFFKTFLYNNNQNFDSYNSSMLHNKLYYANYEFDGHWFKKPLKYEQLYLYNNQYINTIESQFFLKTCLVDLKVKYFLTPFYRKIEDLKYLSIFKPISIDNQVFQSYLLEKPFKDISRIILFTNFMNLDKLQDILISMDTKHNFVLLKKPYTEDTYIYYYIPEGYSSILTKGPLTYEAYFQSIEPNFILNIFNSLKIIKYRILNEIFIKLPDYNIIKHKSPLIDDLSIYLTKVICVNLDFVIELIDINVGNLSILFQLLDACYSFLSNIFDSEYHSKPENIINFDPHIFKNYLKRVIYDSESNTNFFKIFSKFKW